jgi:multidrug efflux pump subunit AcrA (membrane-fusion protein)
MRFLARSVVAVVLLAVTLAVLALAAHTVVTGLQARWAERDAPRPVRERVFAASVLPVRLGQIVPELQVYGEVRSRRTLDIRAPRAGRIVWLADGFEDGAEVAEGVPLLRLDPADATAARDLALADRARAEADARDAARALALARDELASARSQADLRRAAVDRQRALRDRGVGSDAALETAELALQAAEQAVLSRRQAEVTAEARVDQAAVALDRLAITLAEAERALAETEIRAGFAGRLSGVAVVQGGLVGQNERLGQIIDPAQLEVSIRLSTAQYARLVDESGALRPEPVTVALDVLGTEIVATGRLARSAAAVGEGQAGRLVYATLDAAPGFRPGDFVTVRLAEPALDRVVRLPAAALGPDGTVLALGPDDRLEALAVTLERRQGDHVILSGAALDGRDVVAERSPLLGAGIKVRPVRPEASASAAPAPALVDLTPERRAALIAFVEGNARMPPDAKARILDQLAQDKVPAQVVERLESRMGG